MAKVGLVLSGGMVKGAYQIGVLKALQKYICSEDISYVSSSSIGTLGAYSYLQNKLGLYEELWLDNESFNIRSFMRSAVKRSNILDKVSVLVEDHKPIEKEFFTTCLDLTKMHLDYINLNKVNPNQIADYLKASISFVPLFKAIEIGNSKYLDGAVIDNIPVVPLTNYDFDYAIVVHFDKKNYIYQNLENKNVIEINFNTNTSIAKSLSFDTESSKDMITKGYVTADEIFSFVFEKGTQNLECITDRIRFLNASSDKERYNMSGDIAVDRMNHFAKKFVRYNLK